jgi:hypothetical protein
MLRADPEQLRAALAGHVRDHHRSRLRLHLTQSKASRRGRGAIDARLDVLLRPVQAVVERLSTVPEISTLVAQTVIAAIGADVHRSQHRAPSIVGGIVPPPGRERRQAGVGAAQTRCPLPQDSADSGGLGRHSPP